MEFNAIGSGNWERINFDRRSFQVSVLPDIRSDIYFEIVGPTAFLSVRTDGLTVFGKSGLSWEWPYKRETIVLPKNHHY
jgi:hypothetical protein